MIIIKYFIYYNINKQNFKTFFQQTKKQLIQAEIIALFQKEKTLRAFVFTHS